MSFIYTIVDFHIAVNNIKPLSVAMETQQWVIFVLLSSYKIFRTAVNNIKVNFIFVVPCIIIQG